MRLEHMSAQNLWRRLQCYVASLASAIGILMKNMKQKKEG